MAVTVRLLVPVAMTVLPVPNTLAVLKSPEAATALLLLPTT